MAKKLVNKITIVGCGPGSKKYMTAYAVKCIRRAEVIIGSRRLLDAFPDVVADRYILNKNYILIIKKLVALSKHKKIVVLVSGDPGFYSYAKLVIDKVGIENCEVVPGISSVQLAFAYIGITWNDACFVSLHGRKRNISTLIDRVKEYDKVAVLTDDVNNLKLIAKSLIHEGLKDRKVYVCENLSLANERVRVFKVKSLLKVRTGGLNVIIIIDDEE